MSFKLLEVGRPALRRIHIGRSALVAAAICVATYLPSEASAIGISPERSEHCEAMSLEVCSMRSAPSPSFADTPDAYLEYVESTNGQYIDTGVRARSGTRVETGMMWREISGVHYRTFVGARSGANNFLLVHAQNTYKWFYGYGTKSSFLGTVAGSTVKDLVPTDTDTLFTVAAEYTDDGRFSIDINGMTAKVDSGLGALDTGLTLYVFARHRDNPSVDLQCKARCYYLKIYQTDGNGGPYALVRDFRPCIKDNRAGLYDAVEGKIYFSKTDDDLAAGPEKGIVPTDATPLEYVQSAGNHHIDTGIQARSGSKLETGMMWLEGGNKAFLVGRINNGADFKLCHQYGGRFHTAYGANGAKQSSIASAANTYYVVKSEAKGDGSAYLLDVNGAKWFDTAKQTPVNTGFNFWLFAQNGSNSQVVPSKSRCYYLKLWQTNDVDGAYTLVRNFLPCKDPSGTVSLYDTVSKAYFYPNTGTLTAGPEVAIDEVAWTGAAGTFALDNAANWSTGKVPSSANTVTIPVADGETVFTASSALAFGAVKVIGVGSATFPANISMTSFEIAPYVTAKFAAVPGVADGGIKGAGTLVLDPGDGNTVSMTKSNTGFAGKTVIASGTVKYGDGTSFGPVGGSAKILVKSGATLDQAGMALYERNKKKPEVTLEADATLASSAKLGDNKAGVVTDLVLEGNAMAYVPENSRAAMSYHFNTSQPTIKLGMNTLEKTGAGEFFISWAKIDGTGTFHVKEGTVQVTHGLGGEKGASDATIRIDEGATLALINYNNKVVGFTAKDVVLDGGAITRAVNTYTFTVTNSIAGHGSVQSLTLGADAVFKPTGTGYLTITEALSGTMMIDLSELDMSGGGAKPLFKVGSAAMLPAEGEIAFAPGVAKGGWKLRKTADGLGYDLARAGFTIMIR